MSIESKYSIWLEVLSAGERKTIKEQGTTLPIKAINTVKLYKVDEGIIPDTLQKQNKCDYLIQNLKENSSKFIELKGIDIEHACDQIHDTIIFFEQDDDLKDLVDGVDILEGYIVSPNGAVPDISNSHSKKTCRKLHTKSLRRYRSLYDHLKFVRCVSKITGKYNHNKKNRNHILVNNNNPLDV